MRTGPHPLLPAYPLLTDVSYGIRGKFLNGTGKLIVAIV